MLASTRRTTCRAEQIANSRQNNQHALSLRAYAAIKIHTQRARARTRTHMYTHAHTYDSISLGVDSIWGGSLFSTKSLGHWCSHRAVFYECTSWLTLFMYCKKCSTKRLRTATPCAYLSTLNRSSSKLFQTHWQKRIAFCFSSKSNTLLNVD